MPWLQKLLSILHKAKALSFRTLMALFHELSQTAKILVFQCLYQNRKISSSRINEIMEHSVLIFYLVWVTLILTPVHQMCSDNLPAHGWTANRKRQLKFGLMFVLKQRYSSVKNKITILVETSIIYILI